VDEKTIAMAVMNRGYKTVKATTNDPERRIGAVEGLLQRQIDGGAGFLIDPSCTHISNALEWGHRYKKSASGAVTAVAEKNFWSHCFVAGTKVATTVGSVPIEAVTCDHEVLTPKGKKGVVATMCHTASEVVQLTFSNGETVVCTADHPFYTERGLIAANMLEYTDVLFTLGDRTCRAANTQYRNSTGSATTSSQMGTTPGTPEAGEKSTCTALFGRFTSALSLRATTSTTSTGTKRTTESKTSPVSTAPNTSGSTCASTTLQVRGTLHLSRLWAWAERKLRNGTGAPQAQNYTENSEKLRGKTASALNCSAPTVGEPIWGSKNLSDGGFAPCLAKECTANVPGWTTNRERVPYAGRGSPLTSTQRKEPAVRLVGKKHFPGPRKVYDLTVEDEHCFYANGVLVSNCGDAVQYLALHYNVQIEGSIYRRQAPARPVRPSGYVYT
jgi:hypothetical protein